MKDKEIKIIIQKLQNYCAYQERCTQEVIKKTHIFTVDAAEIVTIIAALQEDKFLDEERFACAFVRGKYQYQQWGRNKIVYELKQKRVANSLIQLALKEIKEDTYEAIIVKLTELKYPDFPTISYEDKNKLIRYLLQKGYELESIQRAWKNLSST